MLLQKVSCPCLVQHHAELTLLRWAPLFYPKTSSSSLNELSSFLSASWDLQQDYLSWEKHIAQILHPEVKILIAFDVAIEMAMSSSFHAHVSVFEGLSRSRKPQVHA